MSSAELLTTLTDGPTTEGDLRMLMELRVGLAAEGVSGPARVVDCDVPQPEGTEGDVEYQRTDDTLTCWGRNEVGASNAPAGEFIAVSAENGTSCAIKKADNTILCWGGSYEPHITNGLEPPEGSFGPG